MDDAHFHQLSTIQNLVACMLRGWGGMLNTDSKLEAIAIWIVIGGIIGPPLWVVLALPNPWILWRAILDTQLAADLQRFQTLIAIPVSIISLWGAYLFNRRLEREKEEAKRVSLVFNRAQAVIFELIEVSTEAQSRICDCIRERDKLNGHIGNIRISSSLRKRLPLQDCLINRLSEEELSLLGYNAYGAARVIRLAFRHLARAIDDAPDGDIDATEVRRYFDYMAMRFADVSLNCERFMPVFEAVANQGVDAANALSTGSPITPSQMKAKIAHIVDEWRSARSELALKGDYEN